MKFLKNTAKPKTKVLSDQNVIYANIYSAIQRYLCPVSIQSVATIGPPLRHNTVLISCDEGVPAYTHAGPLSALQRNAISVFLYAHRDTTMPDSNAAYLSTLYMLYTTDLYHLYLQNNSKTY